MSGDFIEVDADLNIYYEQAGEGDITVLLVPGWTMTARQRELLQSSVSPAKARPEILPSGPTACLSGVPAAATSVSIRG